MDLDNEITITWNANENIWFDSIVIATNVISNIWEYVLGADRLAWIGVGRGGCYAMGFFSKQYVNAEFSRKNIFASKM